MGKKLEQCNITKLALQNAMETCTTRQDLADYFGVSLSTIKRRLSDYDLSTFKPSFELDEFMKLYNQNLNDTEIAKITGKSKSAVLRFRIKHNLKSNFKYNYEKLEEEIYQLIAENLTENEVAIELNIDIRIIKYLLHQKNNLISSEELSPEQYQIFLGSMLGDGCVQLTKSTNLGTFIFAHSEKQKEYCIWKSEQLMNICYHHRTFIERGHYDNRTDKTYKSYWCHSHSKLMFKDYFDMWYRQKDNKNIKVIPIKELYKLNPLGIAIWFMDDGYVFKNSYCICTQCFSREELICIQMFFKIRYNIDTTVWADNTLYIRVNSKEIFKNLIKDYIHNDCKYKLSD